MMRSEGWETSAVQAAAPDKSRPARARLAPQSAAHRSRISNVPATLPYVDGRSSAARRYRDIVAQIAVDQGGADHLSEAKLQLIRRFAAASVLAEQLEARLANGEEIDVERHALLCSTLTRLAQRIGIDRRAKNITPSLSDYMVGQENGHG